MSGLKKMAGYDAARVGLGLVLLAAAVLKGHQLATEPVAGSSLLTSRWFLIALVDFELLLGLWLLVGVYAQWTWKVAILCFGGFAGVSFWKAISGEASCGCFGSIQINPWWTLLFDSAAVGMLWRWRPTAIQAQPSAGSSRFHLAALALLYLVGAIPGTMAMVTFAPAVLSADGVIVGEGNLVVLEPRKWVGKQFPLADFIDIGKRLTTGNWIAVLYHHDCPKCQEIIAECERLSADYSSKPGIPPIALVELPPYAQGRDSLSFDGSRITLGQLSKMKDWFVVTPSVIVLSRGQVVEVDDGRAIAFFRMKLRDHRHGD